MPDIVARGRQADGIRACGLCHYPNGQGKMENGGVAGLPAAYILQQLADFKSGARRSADPRKANTNEMVAIARTLTDAEAKAAAEYFASMPWRQWVRVVESEQAPRVRATTNGLFLPVAGAPQEPLGQRIIEMPEQPDSTELVPRSALRVRGVRADWVDREGRGARDDWWRWPDRALHARAMAPISRERRPCRASPADRASYIVRQLHDMQQGTRQTKTMKAAVEKLSVEDMVSITAYVSSREP